jgi:hypothetical protein
MLGLTNKTKYVLVDGLRGAKRDVTLGYQLLVAHPDAQFAGWSVKSYHPNGVRTSLRGLEEQGEGAAYTNPQAVRGVLSPCDARWDRGLPLSTKALPRIRPGSLEAHPPDWTDGRQEANSACWLHRPMEAVDHASGSWRRRRWCVTYIHSHPARHG